jgi:hypothetical protein
MTFYYNARGALRGDGRMSRHYYDIHKLMGSTAKRGSFRLCPSDKLLGPLRMDYDAMSTMIFGEVPTFEAVLESVARAEEQLNAA